MAIEAKVAAVAGEIPAVMADLHAVMTDVADVATVGEWCLGLGSNSGKEEADGE